MKLDKFEWALVSFVIVYAIIFFLVIPILYYEYHYQGIHYPFGLTAPWFYYLFFLVILCVILSIPLYYHRKEKTTKGYEKSGDEKKKERLIVIVLGILSVIWSIVLIFSFLDHMCVGILSADPIARHKFYSCHYSIFARDLIIWIWIFGSWRILSSKYKIKKKANQLNVE